MSTITLIGDIAFNGIISSDPEKNQERFNAIINLLKENEMVFANLEVPAKVCEEHNPLKDLVHFANVDVMNNLLKKLNIGCVSLANNHIYDCMDSGLKATIDLLDELGIYHTGAGWKQSHIEPIIIKKNKSRIGFIAYIHKSTNPKTETFRNLYINYFDLTRAKIEITQLKKKQTDKIICSIHWGIDYSHYATKQQFNIAQELMESGVDIIMGHHPHTLQPYETINGKSVFYSLGGLCFGDFYVNGKIRSLKRKTKLGMIAQLNENNEVKNIIPTRELKGNFIITPKINLVRKLNRLYLLNKLKNKYLIVNILIRFKESVIDRFYEYFFGYYRKPFIQLIQISNIKKIKFIFRDLFMKTA